MPRTINRATDPVFIASLQWPRWPFLPLKRSPQYRGEDLGFLYADNARDEDGVYVYLANLFGMADMTPEQRSAIKRLDYPTVDAMLADGWMVD